jgi:AcrR family transcriptional regulator
VQARGRTGIVGAVAEPKGGDGGDAEQGGLHRLPPGRHGLKRDFVAANQRDRITAGMIAAVAARGYHETKISDIVRAAGLSRRTFYVYFASKEECFVATYDLIAEHLLELAEAAAAEQEGWPRCVRAALAAALEGFAANPDLARFILIAPPRAGEKIAEHYRRWAERTLAQLTTGIPETVAHPSDNVQNALIGGMAGLIVRRVEAGEGERLAELLPDLTELFLTPYLGREEAARLAAGDGA